MKRSFAVLAVLAAVLFAVAYPVAAQDNSQCTCSCVNGEVRPICTSTLAIPPICSPRICSIVPPSIKPIEPYRIPPIGTDHCELKQVYNEKTSRYEWKSICE